MLLCLLKCVDHKKPWTKPSKWNILDDVMEALLNRIALESNSNVAIPSLCFVTKLLALPMETNKPVNKVHDYEQLKKEIMDEEFHIEDVRRKCMGYQNHAAYRWAKKILELLGHQTFFGKTDEILFQLRVMSDDINFNVLFPLFYDKRFKYMFDIYRRCTSVTYTAFIAFQLGF